MKTKIKCISKVRNEKGNIVSYNMISEDGNKISATSKQIKEEMKGNRYEFINLQLDSRGHLIDKKEHTPTTTPTPAKPHPQPQPKPKSAPKTQVIPPNPNGCYTLLKLGIIEEPDDLEKNGKSDTLFRVKNNTTNGESWQSELKPNNPTVNEFTNLAIKQGRFILPKNLEKINISAVIKNVEASVDKLIDYLLYKGGFLYTVDNQIIGGGREDAQKVDDLQKRLQNKLNKLDYHNQNLGYIINDKVCDLEDKKGIYWGYLGTDCDAGDTFYSREQKNIVNHLKNQFIEYISCLEDMSEEEKIGLAKNMLKHNLEGNYGAWLNEEVDKLGNEILEENENQQVMEALIRGENLIGKVIPVYDQETKKMYKAECFEMYSAKININKYVKVYCADTNKVYDANIYPKDENLYKQYRSEVEKIIKNEIEENIAFLRNNIRKYDLAIVMFGGIDVVAKANPNGQYTLLKVGETRIKEENSNVITYKDQEDDEMMYYKVRDNSTGKEVWMKENDIRFKPNIQNNVFTNLYIFNSFGEYVYEIFSEGECIDITKEIVYKDIKKTVKNIISILLNRGGFIYWGKTYLYFDYEDRNKITPINRDEKEEKEISDLFQLLKRKLDKLNEIKGTNINSSKEIRYMVESEVDNLEKDPKLYYASICKKIIHKVDNLDDIADEYREYICKGGIEDTVYAKAYSYSERTVFTAAKDSIEEYICNITLDDIFSMCEENEDVDMGCTIDYYMYKIDADVARFRNNIDTNISPELKEALVILLESTRKEIMNELMPKDE